MADIFLRLALWLLFFFFFHQFVFGVSFLA
jgi:hypothetical protein